MMNSLEKYLSERAVRLPDEKIDFSAAFQSGLVRRGYVIVMTGRSGSTWLASSLQQLPGFGRPEEYFSEPIIHYFWPCDAPQDFSEVFLGIVNKYADQGCFGFKINPDRLLWLGNLVDIEKTFSTSFFSWIDMRRLNLVKQGISYAVAKKSGLWHNFAGKEMDVKKYSVSEDFSDADVWREIFLVLQQEQAIDKFYASAGIVPLRIFYEELSDSKPNLLIRTCRFIRSDIPCDVRSVIDGTIKLDKTQYHDKEQVFTEKFAKTLNQIYCERATISIQQIKQQVQTN